MVPVNDREIWETIALDPPVHVKAGEDCWPVVKAALDRLGRELPPVKPRNLVMPRDGTLHELMLRGASRRASRDGA